MNTLNFSWIIEGKLAGHKALSSEQDLVWLRNQGVLALVRMAETHKTKLSELKIKQMGLSDCHEPVTDFGAPKLPQICRMVEFITQSILNGKPVGVSCDAGQGRTGTILACYLVSQGWDVDRAINEIRAKRPGSIETEEQEEAIKTYATSIGTG